MSDDIVAQAEKELAEEFQKSKLSRVKTILKTRNNINQEKKKAKLDYEAKLKALNECEVKVNEELELVKKAETVDDFPKSQGDYTYIGVIESPFGQRMY